MNEFWQDFFGSLVAGGALIFVLIWLSKSIVVVWLEKALETHKAKLDAANGRAADELRHQFQLLAQEHNVRFSLLYQKRAEVLTRLYYLAYHMHLAWKKVWKQIGYDTEEYSKAKESFTEKSLEFLHFYRENKILLPNDVKTALDNFSDTYFSTEKELVPSTGAHTSDDGTLDLYSWKTVMEEWHSKHYGPLLDRLEIALSEALDPR